MTESTPEPIDDDTAHEAEMMAHAADVDASADDDVDPDRSAVVTAYAILTADDVRTIGENAIGEFDATVETMADHTEFDNDVCFRVVTMCLAVAVGADEASVIARGTFDELDADDPIGSVDQIGADFAAVSAASGAHAWNTETGIAIPNGMVVYDEGDPGEPIAPDAHLTAIGDGRPAADPDADTVDAEFTEPNRRRLVAGGWSDADNPDDVFRVPGQHEFDTRHVGFHDDYIHSSTLERVGAALIAERQELTPLRGVVIKYAWKRSGGGSAGRRKLGACSRMTGLTRYLGRGHFLVWLAADNMRECHATNFHIEAALFHELKHVGVDDAGLSSLLKHDVEMFDDEVRRYGAWRSDLMGTRNAFTQAPMFKGDGWYALGVDLAPDDD